MGGDRNAYWVMSRVLAVCGHGTAGCHGMIESERAVAYTRGWLVHRPGLGVDLAAHCAGQPVMYRGRSAYLGVDGSVRAA